ncbi:MAG: ferrochelatase [Pyrinomonadaceae bacterium]
MNSISNDEYDAILFVSFGAPEQPADVMPFLRNVTRGRGVPDERLLEVAENYQMFGGKSPLNEQNKELITALKKSLAEINVHLPIYWGNRNWDPFLSQAMSEMKRDGVKRALAFVTSAYSSYSGCRQYREDIEKAKQEAGAEDLQIDKIRVFYNHPNFIYVNAENLQNALGEILDERRAKTEIAFTAHSLPLGMAQNCDYEIQLLETCRLVADSINHKNWRLVFQSRSGAPQMSWLEPDINDHLRELKAKGATDIVVQPIGFISDHQEVIFDLDTQAKATAEKLGLNLVRAKTVGTHPAFVAMIRELILERMTPNAERRFIGMRGANHDVCPMDCCLSGHVSRPKSL